VIVSPPGLSTPPHLLGLNPEQERAATHVAGPILIIAGAGTGKTRTLAARVAHLVAQGVAPERILLLTFSRQAAREMLSRVEGHVAQRVWGGTFHAIAHRLLRIYADRMGLAAGFTVIDRTDAEDLLDLAREGLGLESSAEKGGPGRFPRKATCLAIYSRCVNSGEPIEEVVRRRFPWVASHEAALKTLFRSYEERKHARAVLDLDDLLVWWQGLQEDSELGSDVAARFDHVLVDEYQDTNRLQRAILLALRRDNKNLSVVGDDAQAIYGFRAATVRNILDFERDFPGATVVRLEENYRSTGPILDATNGVIGLARDGYRKNLRATVRGEARPLLVRVRDEASEVQFVVRAALERLEQGILLRRQAVLFRAAHHSDLLEVELGRRRIPFRKFGGLRFLDAAHVKDLLAFLRIAENPTDETAWFRVLKLLEGVGPKTAKKLVDRVVGEASRGSDRRQILTTLEDGPVPAAARPSWRGLGELLSSLATEDALPVAAEIDRIRAFYAPLLQTRYDRPEGRGQDLDALARIAQAASSRRDFLADVTLDPPASTGDLAGPPVLDEDWLVLSTIHSAKGLEWDAVTVIHAADGCIPSDLATGDVEDVEEERRLFYVALTRARRFLTVVAPLRFHVRDRQPTDRHTYAPLTRFLPPEVARFFDAASDPSSPRDESAARTTSRPAAADQVRERILKRWES
jgi:DNA helicase-2/ATP-dependent DNA helicase PcrA